MSLPSDLVEALRRRTPNLSAYLAEAARERLQHEVVSEALEQGYGAWREDLHPDLKTANDIARYVRDLRAKWRRRTA